jgi:hypothetical protein
MWVLLPRREIATDGVEKNARQCSDPSGQDKDFAGLFQIQTGIECENATYDVDT